MTSQQSLEDQKVQAAYEALEQASEIVRAALPGLNVTYEEPPGFICVELNDQHFLAYGLANDTANCDVMSYRTMDTVGAIVPGLVNHLNDDPQVYADDLVAMVKKYLAWPA